MTTHTRTPREQVALIAEQIGSELEPDNARWTNRFKIGSQTSSSIYTVAQLKEPYGDLPAGTWGCSCRGWTMHVYADGHRECKHLVGKPGQPGILARLAEVAATAQTDLDASVLDMLRSARTQFLDLGGASKIKRRAGTGRQLDL